MWSDTWSDLILSSTLAGILKIDYREQGQKQKIQQSSHCSNLERDQRCSVEDGSQTHGKKWDPGCILNVKPIGFVDGVDVECKRE